MRGCNEYNLVHDDEDGDGCTIAPAPCDGAGDDIKPARRLACTLQGRNRGGIGDGLNAQQADETTTSSMAIAEEDMVQKLGGGGPG